MNRIEPMPDLDPKQAELLRIVQDASDAIAYAFAVPSLTVKRKPIFIGIDWAKMCNTSMESSE